MFFKNLFFSRFSINSTCCSTDQNCDKIFGLILPNSIGIRSMLDWSKLKNFQFLSIWPKIFCMHHSHVLHCFMYPYCSFVVISLIVFTHNMHKLCYIGYSTWSKNWLIYFWVMYFLVYAIFMCKLQKIFFLRDMIDN